MVTRYGAPVTAFGVLDGRPHRPSDLAHWRTRAALRRPPKKAKREERLWGVLAEDRDKIKKAE